MWMFTDLHFNVFFAAQINLFCYKFYSLFSWMSVRGEVTKPYWSYSLRLCGQVKAR